MVYNHFSDCQILRNQSPTSTKIPNKITTSRLSFPIKMANNTNKHKTYTTTNQYQIGVNKTNFIQIYFAKSK